MYFFFVQDVCDFEISLKRTKIRYVRRHRRTKKKKKTNKPYENLRKPIYPSITREAHNAVILFDGVARAIRKSYKYTYGRVHCYCDKTA